MPTDVVIVSAARTPIATAYKGSLIGVDAFTLAELAMGAALERSGVDPHLVDDIGFGESMQGGGNIGRNVAVRLGMNDVPGVAMQRWCASGMAGVQWIAANIAAGIIDCRDRRRHRVDVDRAGHDQARTRRDARLVALPRQRGDARCPAVQHGAHRRRQHRPPRRHHPRATPTPGRCGRTRTPSGRSTRAVSTPSW